MPCSHAITSLLEKDRRKRIGASGFDTFTDHSFFRKIDFEALEKKQIPPVFIPSSEKTNFDATYDLEELLLEEAPLEARARRQKPRMQLKDDATDKEIRTDELHRMIETLFEPFDYTTVTYDIPSIPFPTYLPLLAPQLNSPNDSNYKGFVDAPTPAESTLDNLLDQATPTKSNTEDPTQTGPLSDSPNGSPPMTVSGHHLKSSTTQSTHSDYYPTNETPSPPPLLGGQQAPLSQQQQGPTSHPATNPRNASRQTRGGTRSVSKGGGFQVVLDDQGSWADLNNAPSNTSGSGEGREGGRTGTSGSGSGKGKPNGMLGFLSRKKGRERSPKPQEAGVLGKEGARVVVGGR